MEKELKENNTNMKERIGYRCQFCKSEDDIAFEALGYWDKEKQEFKYVPFHRHICCNCHKVGFIEKFYLNNNENKIK